MASAVSVEAGTKKHAPYIPAIGAFQKVLAEDGSLCARVWDHKVQECLKQTPYAKGGQGSIYKCADDSQHPRAVKLSQRYYSDHTLTKELKVLRDTRGNEGIVQLVSAGCLTNPPRPYLVMEWCPLNLWQKLEQNTPETFSLKERLQTVAHITTALIWLHEQARYVHSDLRGQNILITESGAPKLADFGLSFSLREPRVNRCIKKVIQGHIAPERFKNPEDCPATEAIDIYGAGIILLELLSRTTGHPCIKDQIGVPCGWYIRRIVMGINPMTVANQRISVLEGGNPGVHPLTFPELQQPVVKSVWDDLIVRNLNFTPKSRHQSARALLTELQAQMARIT